MVDSLPSAVAEGKSRVTMTLDQDVVRRARGLTANLSETVQSLLAAFVEREERLRDSQAERAAATAACFAEVDLRNGSLAEEFPGF